MKSPWAQIRAAVVATGVLTVICCGLYPLAVWTVAQLIFPGRANGSLILDANGKVRGSRLLGQNFSEPKFFQPRPSAAGNGYDGTSSGGSNLGPTSQKLRDSVQARVEAYRAQNGLPVGETVPADAVTASGSGLDPHISLRNAELQAPRVARIRQLDLEVVRGLLRQQVEGPDLGILGEPGVNVLMLNLSLEALR